MVTLVVGAVRGGAADEAVMEVVVSRVLVEAVVLVVVTEVAAPELGCAADGVMGSTVNGTLMPVQPMRSMLEKQ